MVKSSVDHDQGQYCHLYEILLPGIKRRLWLLMAYFRLNRTPMKWIHVGQTQGRGKLDTYKLKDIPTKDIFLFPLNKNFRKTLTAPM